MVRSLRLLKEWGQVYGSGTLERWREGGRRDEIEGEENLVEENRDESSGEARKLVGLDIGMGISKMKWRRVVSKDTFGLRLKPFEC